MWSPLLEKAYAIHAGGWVNIDGGCTAIGISCITGCTDTYKVFNTQTTRVSYGNCTFKPYRYQLYQLWVKTAYRYPVAKSVCWVQAFVTQGTCLLLF